MSNIENPGTQQAEPGSGTTAAKAKDMASSASETVKQEIRHFASAAQTGAKDQISQKKEIASDAISDFANAIRRAGDDLAQNDRTMTGRSMKRFADGLGDFAETLSQKDPEELFDLARDFGRRNPVVFAAGALLAGFAIGRVVRTTVEPDDGADPTTGDSGELGARANAVETAP